MPERPLRSSPWVVLAGAVVIQGATSPGQTLGVSVFVDEIAHDLDLSRSAVSSAYLIGTLAGAIAMPAAGRLIDNRGLRFATVLFGTLFGAVLIAMAGVTGFVTLALGFAGTRAFGQGALTLTATTTVAVWFDENRGLANGVKTAAGGALMALVPVGSSLLIATFGWRTSWIVLGLCAWAIVLPLGLFLIRNPGRPQYRETSHTSDAPPAPAVPAPSWPVGDVLRHPAFLAMTGATALAALVGTGLMFHHIDLLAERGLTSSEAAAVFLPLTLSSAASAVIAGRFADRISPRVVAAVALLLLGTSPILVQVAAPGAMAALYGATLGAAGTVIRTVEATALPRWFGVASIGQIRGFVMAAGVAASAVGPLIFSVGRDISGDYPPVLNLMALLSLALALVVAAVKPPVARSFTSEKVL
ncbi:MAG: MFS transporter [Acidimicrobiales bacterium]